MHDEYEISFEDFARDSLSELKEIQEEEFNDIRALYIATGGFRMSSNNLKNQYLDNIQEQEDLTQKLRLAYASNNNQILDEKREFLYKQCTHNWYLEKHKQYYEMKQILENNTFKEYGYFSPFVDTISLDFYYDKKHVFHYYYDLDEKEIKRGKTSEECGIGEKYIKKGGSCLYCKEDKLISRDKKYYLPLEDVCKDMYGENSVVEGTWECKRWEDGGKKVEYVQSDIFNSIRGIEKKPKIKIEENYSKKVDEEVGVIKTIKIKDEFVSTEIENQEHVNIEEIYFSEEEIYKTKEIVVQEDLKNEVYEEENNFKKEEKSKVLEIEKKNENNFQENDQKNNEGSINFFKSIFNWFLNVKI